MRREERDPLSGRAQACITKSKNARLMQHVARFGWYVVDADRAFYLSDQESKSVVGHLQPAQRANLQHYRWLFRGQFNYLLSALHKETAVLVPAEVSS